MQLLERFIGFDEWPIRRHMISGYYSDRSIGTIFANGWSDDRTSGEFELKIEIPFIIVDQDKELWKNLKK